MAHPRPGIREHSNQSVKHRSNMSTATLELEERKPNEHRRRIHWKQWKRRWWERERDGQTSPKGRRPSLMRVRTCTSPIKLKRLKVHAVGLCEQNVVTLALTFHGYKDNGEGQTTAFRVLGWDSPPHCTTEFQVPLKRIHASADRSALKTLSQETTKCGQDTLRGEVDPRRVVVLGHIECAKRHKRNSTGTSDPLGAPKGPPR